MALLQNQQPTVPARPARSFATKLPHQAERIHLWLTLKRPPVLRTTGNRSGIFSLGTSPTSVDPAHLAVEEHSWQKTTKTDIVVPVIGIVVVAVGATQVDRFVVPPTPAQDLCDLYPHKQKGDVNHLIVNAALLFAASLLATCRSHPAGGHCAQAASS